MGGPFSLNLPKEPYQGRRRLTDGTRPLACCVCSLETMSETPKLDSSSEYDVTNSEEHAARQGASILIFRDQNYVLYACVHQKMI